MAVEIFIARHGQNEDNAQGILNGRRDLPLTELGRSQADELAEGIQKAGLKFDAVYCSPLSRAHETAQIVCEKLGSPEPKILAELTEREFGVMTGVPVAEIEKRCAPGIIKTESITYFLNAAGAETFDELLARAGRVLEIVSSQHKSGKLLLVCHGDLGKMIYAVASKTPWQNALRDFHFGNGELIDVDPDNRTHVIKLEQYNL